MKGITEDLGMYLCGIRERFDDSCGLLMSSNSFELLRNIGILDFRSLCFDWPNLISEVINFVKILGGFIKEILSEFCSWLFPVSSCSSIFVLVAIVTTDRSGFFGFMASADGTSSSWVLDNFSADFVFVRSYESTLKADISGEIATSSRAASFTEPLQSICSFASCVTGSSWYERGASPCTGLTISFSLMMSWYSWRRDGKLRYMRSSGDFLAADQRVGGPAYRT